MLCASHLPLWMSDCSFTQCAFEYLLYQSKTLPDPKVEIIFFATDLEAVMMVFFSPSNGLFYNHTSKQGLQVCGSMVHL